MTTRLAPFPPLTGREPCRRDDVDPDLFFDADSTAITRARRLCIACPLRTACLSWALDHPAWTTHGVWGATTPERRDELRVEFTTNSEKGNAA
ncbi:WhiB family transcriptional regulator [Streptomyces sp. RKND-216]|uniref:WhiB family transcriptional regulator n=1 Tax=Streptomyces sp. RKND-216 TaxID=2562581 RepID=UPI00109DB72C|nr:WhiB family transcriptional regulator [Streptomyces sp. RKND-216]THA28264.1 WhiB family transcriptional regulator [Streptomyces sp. RKND-216]